MCVIIDTNMIGIYIMSRPPKDPEELKYYEAMKLLEEYIDKRKIKLISPPENNNFWGEHRNNAEFNRLLMIYKNKHIMKTTLPKDLKRAKQELAFKEKKYNIKYKSNKKDFPILVSAKASNTKLLASKDRKLGDDFKNFIGGKIYKHKTKKERKMLDSNKCS